MNKNYEEIIYYGGGLNVTPIYGSNERFIIIRDFSYEYTSPYWNYNFLIGLNKFRKRPSVIDPDSLDQIFPINLDRKIYKITNTTVYPYLIFNETLFEKRKDIVLFDLEREKVIVKNYPIDNCVYLLDYKKIGGTDLFLCKNNLRNKEVQIYTENETVLNFNIHNYDFSMVYGLISKISNNIIISLRSGSSKITLLTFDLRYNKDPTNRIFYDMKPLLIYSPNRISVDEKFIYLTALNNVFGLSISKKNIKPVIFNKLRSPCNYSFYTDYYGYTELSESETKLIQDKLDLIEKLTSLKKLLLIFLTKIEYNIT